MSASASASPSSPSKSVGFWSVPPIPPTLNQRTSMYGKRVAALLRYNKRKSLGESAKTVYISRENQHNESPLYTDEYARFDEFIVSVIECIESHQVIVEWKHENDSEEEIIRKISNSSAVLIFATSRYISNINIPNITDLGEEALSISDDINLIKIHARKILPYACDADVINSVEMQTEMINQGLRLNLNVFTIENRWWSEFVLDINQVSYWDYTILANRLPSVYHNFIRSLLGHIGMIG